MLARQIITTEFLLINAFNKARPNLLLKILGWTSQHHEISMMRTEKGENSQFQPHTEFFILVKYKESNSKRDAIVSKLPGIKRKRDLFNAQKSFGLSKTPTSFLSPKMTLRFPRKLAEKRVGVV